MDTGDVVVTVTAAQAKAGQAAVRSLSSVNWRSGKAASPSTEWQKVLGHNVAPQAWGINIHRRATQMLNIVRLNKGIRAAQNAIWHFGDPPAWPVCLNIGKKFCYTIGVVRNKVRGYIYQKTWQGGPAKHDLAQAIYDARRSLRHGCTRIQVIPMSNWTYRMPSSTCPVGTLT